MTDQERTALITTLRNLGKSMDRTGDARDLATATCLYGVCIAIDIGAEVELAYHISTMDLSSDTEVADEAGNVRGH